MFLRRGHVSSNINTLDKSNKDAVLKYISLRTSYNQVRLAFHRLNTDHPRILQQPPVRSSILTFAKTSNCPYLDHLGSGFFFLIIVQLRLAFTTYFYSLERSSRKSIIQKVPPHLMTWSAYK